MPLAAFFPERVRSLVLISSALGGKRTLAEIKVAVDEKQTTTFTADGLPIANDAAMSAKIMGLVNAGPIAAEQNASRRRAGRWIQPSKRGVAITDIKGLLTHVNAPTLLLYGDKPSGYLRFRAGAEAALKNAHTQYVPNSGTFTMQDNPTDTIAALQSFLKSVDP